MADDLPQGLALTPLDPGFNDDMHSRLDHVRATCPVMRDEQLGAVIVTREVDVKAVLADRTLGADPRKSLPDALSRLYANCPPGMEAEYTPSMLFADDPDHGRLRRLVSKAFTPRAVDATLPIVEAEADRLIDAMIAKGGEIDLIAEFAGPLPTVVIAHMLGVETARMGDFKRWSDALVFALSLVKPPELVEKVEAAGEAMSGYFHEMIAKRRARPGEDLISAMIRAEDDDERLTDDQIVQLCNLLLTAGNVTTTDLIGNGVHALLSNRAQWERLSDDPSLAENAVEEVLRYDSPVITAARIPHADFELGDVEIENGRTIVTSLAAANHDPAVHDNPHLFDIGRMKPRHHSFGGGIHFCLGAPLARAEGAIAFRKLAERLPHLTLGTTPNVRRTLPGFHGFETMWVKVP
ncbi:MAG: cytochrome P450 [Pacificimonas sp.]